MGNYALRTQLNALERELSREQTKNRELNSELAIIINGTLQANEVLENYNSNIRTTLENCNHSIHSSHQKVIDTIALQGEIETLYMRLKQIELANKKIRECNNKKYYDFAIYRTVRKIVQGMMDNLDILMVSDQAITKSVERNHLQVPDYWLTCVLISIMAWRNDDKELADRAMARAIQLEKKSSAIFYMLFNIRMEREQAALKWFDTYQQCALKGSDQRTFLMLFSLISKTISENIEDKTRDEIFSFIKKVIENNMKSSGYHETEIIDKIEGYFNRMEQAEPLSYPLINKYCNDVKQLTSVMMKVQNNKNILEFILNLIHVPKEQKNTFLKKYIDDLIASPNQVEKGVYDEIAYYELVIQCDGDVSEAKKQAESISMKAEDELNLIDEMIEWIYKHNDQEINGQIKLNLFTLTKWIQEQAVQSHVEHYRKERKKKYNITIEDYVTTVDLKKEEDEKQKIQMFYTEKKNIDLSKVKSWPIYMGVLIGMLGFFTCIFEDVQSWIVIPIGVGYSIWKHLQNKSKKNRIEKFYEKRKKSITDIMNKLLIELQKYNREFDEYDAYYEQIKDTFAKV